MERNLGVHTPHLGSQIPRGLPPHAIRRNLGNAGRRPRRGAYVRQSARTHARAHAHARGVVVAVVLAPPASMSSRVRRGARDVGLPAERARATCDGNARRHPTPHTARARVGAQVRTCGRRPCCLCAWGSLRTRELRWRRRAAPAMCARRRRCARASGRRRALHVTGGWSAAVRWA